MSAKVFIDSGAFIAFLDRSDNSHTRAAELFRQPTVRWSTSGLVIAETYSWLLFRLGEDAARTLRALLDTLRGLEILEQDARHRAAVWAKLDRLRGSKLTYVDASSLVWIGERKIPTVWGTDRDLAFEGAQVLPGPPPY
ncbi:MAG: type II toxin-antitoxin system VapC family toxin [Thermoanaerobaculia bacterium]|nr:type II toxin-antitoxin system VapC family toxin [Thermoanaerobaculia bacterium]